MSQDTIGILHASINPRLHSILRRRRTEAKQDEISVFPGILERVLGNRGHGSVGGIGLFFKRQPGQCESSYGTRDERQCGPDQCHQENNQRSRRRHPRADE